MGKILVTGADGFIGRNLLPVLRAKGWTVDAPGRAECDFLVGRSVAAQLKKSRPELVVHLAYPDRRDPDQAPASLAMLEYLLKAMEGVQVGRIVNLGTGYEYASFAHPCREEDPLAGVGDYGRAKVACFRRLMLEPARSRVHLRPFFLFGCHESKNRLIPTMIESILNNRTPPLGDPDVARDFLAVDDLCAGIAGAIERFDTLEPRVLNIASGEAYFPEELIEHCRVALGRGAERVRAAKPAPLQSPARKKIVADIGLARRSLGFVPTPIGEQLSHYAKEFLPQ